MLFKSSQILILRFSCEGKLYCLLHSLNILIIVTAVAFLCSASGEQKQGDLWNGSEMGVEPGCWPFMMMFDFSIPVGSRATKIAFLPEKINRLNCVSVICCFPVCCLKHLFNFLPYTYFILIVDPCISMCVYEMCVLLFFLVFVSRATTAGSLCKQQVLR